MIRRFMKCLGFLRSHGMLRESGNKSYEKKVIKKNKTLSPQFTFLYPTYEF